MLITRLWQQQEGKYFCISSKDHRGKWRDEFFKRSEFKEVRDYLEENKDKDLYFCPHGFDKPKRLKIHAVLPKLLWADLDAADPRTIKFKPSIAIESSPNRFVGLWVIDEVMTEDLNRAMAYTVGADPSGWDITQVLRIPNTTNYKYTSTPRVRTMWSDGDSYRVRDLKGGMPKKALSSDNDNGTTESDSASIYKKYEKKLPAWCRRELISGKATAGKRSEMIWKLEQTLIEKGVSQDEAFVLIKASPWNKFAGRRNEDDQLRRELDKAINHHFKAAKPAIDTDDEDDEGPRLTFRSMDQVERENLDWVWYPYLARGELTILEGDPGLGKSYMMQMVAKAICDGEKLPSVRPARLRVGKVVYCDIENAAGSVTKPRLETNGMINYENFIQCEEPFTIEDEDCLDELYDQIEEIKPELVVFDTVNTYLGKADAYKSHEVQQAFRRFLEIARRYNCSVVVLRHLTKSTKEKALYRGQGSIAFTGLARVVMTVGVHPDDGDTRVMAVTKLNVTKRPPAMTFTINALPNVGKDTDRSKLTWGDFVDLDADDILAAPEKADPKEKDAVIAFLKQELKSGALDYQKLKRMAEGRSISERMLNKVAEELGIEKSLKGFGKDKRTTWALPDDEDEDE